MVIDNLAVLSNNIKRKNVENLNAINEIITHLDNIIGELQTRQDWQTISQLGTIRQSLDKLKYDVEYAHF